MDGRHRLGRLYFKKQSSQQSAWSGKNGRGLLFVIRTAIVWFVLCIWWVTMESFLPIQVNFTRLFAGLFVVTIVGGILLNSKRSYLWLAVIGIGAGIIIWRNQSLFATAVNHLANVYLTQFPSDSLASLRFNEWTSDPKALAMAFVILQIPMVLILAAVMRSGRGRFPAGVLIAAPLILAAIEMCFPPVMDCCIWLMAAGIYFALTGCDTGGAALKKGIVTAMVLFVVLAVTVFAGGRIEALKRANHPVYTKIKNATEETIAKPIREWTVEREENQKTAEEKKPESATQNKELQADIPDITFNQTAYGDMSNLKALASFIPKSGELGTLTLTYKPEKTVYSAKTYGEDYDGQSWSERETSEHVFSADSMVPDSILRLRAFREENETNSLEDTERVIRREFEENTVYSYTPGTTPTDKDFAEYFLFDHQKGFCVHFATTAVLLYRLYGYPARYAEGYAVEPSEFTQQADGTWQAEITGAMGHAWCEVYDGDTWIVKEHTLAYSGNEEQTNPPAMSTQQIDQEENGKSAEEMTLGQKIMKQMLRILCAAIVILLLSGCFLLQAAVRRKRTKRSFYKGNGAGIQNMYMIFYRIAVFLSQGEKESQKKMQKDILSPDTLTFMKKNLPYISEDEWVWMSQLVLESMFYKRKPEREEQIKMHEIYLRMEKQVQRQLTGWQLVKYRYVTCLG